jgi:hypothetical protein
MFHIQTLYREDHTINITKPVIYESNSFSDSIEYLPHRNKGLKLSSLYWSYAGAIVVKCRIYTARWLVVTRGYAHDFLHALTWHSYGTLMALLWHPHPPLILLSSSPHPFLIRGISFSCLFFDIGIHDTEYLFGFKGESILHRTRVYI